MKQAIVIIGIGELAGVFARGFLRCGYPVYPITRDMDMNVECQNIPEPALVLVAVQENELHGLLEKIPMQWREKLALIQNELLPRDWQLHQLQNPTVTVVWFEKKKQMELRNILYSPSYGPQAALMSEALQAVGVPAPVLENSSQLLYELVRKSVYILTVNIAGLVDNCSVESLWDEHQGLAREIGKEVIQVQSYLCQQALDEEQLIEGMVEGIRDCPHRNCLGRRALSRLQRTLQHAQEANISTPKLLQILQQAESA